MTPISVQLYTVREEAKDGKHPQIFREIADIGYKGVEGGAGYGMDNQAFRAMVEDLGMVISSTWGPIPENDAAIQELVDLAGELGTPNLVGGLWIPDFEDEEAIRRTADRINYGLPALRKAGLSFSLHNHWMEFEPLGDRLKVDLLADLCPDLLFEVDIYWCTNFGVNNAAHQVAKLKDRIELLHVKDGPQVKGRSHVAVGDGTINVGEVLAEADPSRLRWNVVELDECDTDMLAAVRKSYDYLVGNGLAEGNRAV